MDYPFQLNAWDPEKKAQGIKIREVPDFIIFFDAILEFLKYNKT